MCLSYVVNKEQFKRQDKGLLPQNEDKIIIAPLH